MEKFVVKGIIRLVPHQNNIVHTKDHSFKKKILVDYQEHIQYDLISQRNKRGFKKIKNSFVKIIYHFHYKVTGKKSLSDFHDLFTTQRGDYVNIAKSVDDAIEGVLYENDKQIIDARSILVPSREYKIIIFIKPVDISEYEKLLDKV